MEHSKLWPFDRSRPLQRRLTLLTALAVAITGAVTCMIGWFALQVTVWNNSEKASLAMARDLGPLVRDDIATTGRLSDRVNPPGVTLVAAVRSDGAVLSVPGEGMRLPVGPPEVAAARSQVAIVRNASVGGGETYRIVSVPFGSPGYVLAVGRPLTSSNQILHVFGLVVLIVGAVGVFWAGILGRAVAKTALRPVVAFTQVVHHVSETEDLEPISTEPYTGGDLSTLANTFNRMLGRLATSRDQQDRLVADASHELRTPLTSMRTNIDLLALDAGSGLLGDAGRTAILGDVQSEMASMTKLITDLLQLTRDTTGLEHEPVDLREVVESAAEQAYQGSSGLTFDVAADSLSVFGDRDGLERAVTNLLDNAVRWSPPGGTITVHLCAQGLRISDEGPGIADADLPHVFERFYRGEAARSTPGTGLGLAIAAKAVHDHGGTIEAGRSPQGGAELTIRLPVTGKRPLVPLG